MTTPEGGNAATTFAWLIEAGPDSAGAYWWWGDGWVRDAWLATRYESKEDAEAAAHSLNLTARAVEHGFMAGGTDA